MKRFTLFCIISIALLTQAYAQNPAVRAYLDEDGRVLTEEIIIDTNHPLAEVRNEGFGQVEPWPIRVPAHPNFKSFRGVTLADMDGDGVDEILVAAFNRIHVFKGNGDILWSYTLIGTATYPPSVADVTGDGNLEVVQLTGGIPNNGRVYLFNSQGEVMPGYPISYNNQWILSAPALADLDGDGQLEIVFGIRTVNELHVIKADGSPMNENWPVTLVGIPAFTPSIGDIDGDGNKEIIASASNGTLYAFDLNGQTKPGFPVQAPSTGFSYQSPLLVDFDGDGTLDIVGATHGNAPQYYVRKHNGEYREGWPVPVPGGGWTYHPPTVVDINDDGNFEIFTAKPIGEAPMPMLFGFNPAGEMLDNFPIEKSGGLEGFLSVADIDGDGQLDLIFGSNMMVDQKGFIHAFKTDGSGQIPGFPLRPDGFTFMNGANLGDVTGDGILNIVALSYEQTFSATDSTVINVYHTGIPMAEANIRFGTYKGSNTRTGLVMPYEEPEIHVVTGVQAFEPLEVPFGTPIEELDLPEMAEVELNNDPDHTTMLQINWEPGDPEYDGYMSGVYPFIGHLVLTGNIENPDGITASIHVEVMEEEHEWSFIRLMNASNDLTDIHVLLNGEVLLTDFPTGMTSDTIHVKMNQMHTLDVIHAGNGDVLESYEFILENDYPYHYYSEAFGMQIILAGKLDAEAPEEYALSFFTRVTSTEPTDTDSFLMRFFDAYINPDAETAYEVTTMIEWDEWWGSDLSEIYFGHFSGVLLHTEPHFAVEIHLDNDSESTVYENHIDLGKNYGWGSPGMFVIILDFHPDPDVDGSYPHFLLLPPMPHGGMVQAPDVTLDVEDLTGNDGAMLSGTLYPNPAAREVVLAIHAPEPGMLSVELTDITGRALQSMRHELSVAGRNEVTIDLDDIKPGFYMVRCQFGGRIIGLPLVVTGQ